MKCRVDNVCCSRCCSGLARLSACPTLFMPRHKPVECLICPVIIFVPYVAPTFQKYRKFCFIRKQRKCAKCGKCLPLGIDCPEMSQRKRNNSRQIILKGPLIGLMAWNHSQRFKLNRSQLSRSHDWFTGSTTTTTQRLNLKSQALIVYTEHCMQMAYG